MLRKSVLAPCGRYRYYSNVRKLERQRKRRKLRRHGSKHAGVVVDEVHLVDGHSHTAGAHRLTHPQINFHDPVISATIVR